MAVIFKIICGPPSCPSNFINLKSILIILLLTFQNFGGTRAGDRILFFIGGLMSYSHRSSVQPLAARLAEKGHEVTFHSPLSIHHANITEFCSKELIQFTEPFMAQFGVAGLGSRVRRKYANDFFSDPTGLFDVGWDMCKVFLSSPSTLEWIDRSQFDLIVVDNSLNECVYGLAHFWGTKTISYSSISSLFMWDVVMFGLPPELSWIPGYDSVFEGQMGFYDRVYNAFLTSYWSWKFTSYHLPRIDLLVREQLGHRVEKMPPLEKVMRDTSLMLLNHHYSDQFPRPYPPFVVGVGGMHVQETPNGTLSRELESFLKGKEGFIYISFGSIVRISTIPPSLLETFLEAIKGHPNLGFLWKWEGPVPTKNVGQNILFKKWFPQQNVLAHPKIRGFITQGGHVSLQQAICHGVPLIQFPTSGDQDFSAKRVRSVGNGIEMEFSGLTSLDLQQAINKLMKEARYKEAAKKLATACRDRPMSPLETAVWWVEYVLRTEDTSLLKPTSMNQPLWMYWCLDVWIFLFSIALAAILVSVGGILFLCSELRKLSNHPSHDNKQLRRDKPKIS